VFINRTHPFTRSPSQSFFAYQIGFAAAQQQGSDESNHKYHEDPGGHVKIHVWLFVVWRRVFVVGSRREKVGWDWWI